MPRKPQSKHKPAPWPEPVRRRVALIVETSNAHDRALLQGVFAYARETKSWLFSLMDQGRADVAPAWLADWEGDGIIARIKNRRIAATVLASGLPTVDLSSGHYLPSLPTVEPDDVAIAELAADHFIKRGFKNFAYCDHEDFLRSESRGKAFRKALVRAGFNCLEFRAKARAGAAISSKVTEIGEWLKRLPKPMAIFAGHDTRAQHVLDACSQVGLVVPDEVAVLGVDNDDLVCEMTIPPLSSIIPNARRTGYEAARLLDRMMQGEKTPPMETRIEPLGVKLRQSTDVLAVDDAQVALALRYIREHVCEPIMLADVLRVVRLPRRTLEKRFRCLLNRTVHEEILAVRINWVKQLLSNTKLSMKQIAEVMAYEHPEYLGVVFKREAGISPREYRRRHEYGGLS